MKKRFPEIDMLRGIAMIAMILIHTCYYFLNDKIALFIWNWSQFAVPVFIFCSSYLFFKNPKPLSLRYLKIRILRLIYPYYVFLLFFIPLVFFLTPQKINIKYILHSIFLIGGTDINWLILLFVHMTIILPLIVLTFNKFKPLFYLFSLISILSSLIFIFIKFPFSYKYIMWLPWSIIPIFGLFFALNESKKNILMLLSTLSFIVFAASYYIEIVTKHNLGMYENKYPPTIYFLTYGIFMIMLLYFFSKLIIKNGILTKIISFFSIYSYSIYFIHYTVLIILATYLKYLKLNWITFSLLVLTLTVIMQIGFNNFKRLNLTSKLL